MHLAATPHEEIWFQQNSLGPIAVEAKQITGISYMCCRLQQRTNDAAPIHPIEL